MKRTTREWVKKYEEDYVLSLRDASRSKLRVHNGVYFHCQQCAEKYLKGLMEELGLHMLKIPRTRSAIELLASAISHA